MLSGKDGGIHSGEEVCELLSLLIFSSQRVGGVPGILVLEATRVAGRRRVNGEQCAEQMLVLKTVYEMPADVSVPLPFYYFSLLTV